MKFTSTFLRAGSLAAVVCLGAAQAQGSHEQVTADEWEARLAVSDGVSKAAISFGMRPDATEGYDRLWEVKAMFGAGLRSYFYRPGWQMGAYYVRDIRGPGFPTKFDFDVAGLVAGRTIKLQWDTRYVPFGCERVDLYLIDHSSGARVDMRLQDSYTFTADANRSRKFLVETELVMSEGLPAAPQLLSVQRPGVAEQVTVRWNPSQRDALAVGVNVYRISSKGHILKLNEFPVQAPLFHDRTLEGSGEGSGYYVRALNRDLCEGRPSVTLPLRGVGVISTGR